MTASRTPGNTEEKTGSASRKPENRLAGLSFHRDPKSTAAFWSHTLYRSPQGRKVIVEYATNVADSERIARKLLNEKVLGFDLEWIANDRQRRAAACSTKANISLMQVACETRIALFHIALHEGTTTSQLLAPTLKRIIESPMILKVGVNVVNADARRLTQYMGLEPKGLFELTDLYRLSTPTRRALVALATQVQDHLGLPLFKGRAIRCGAWEKELKWRQKQYAADDAYVGFMLYHKMNADRLNMTPAPPHPNASKILQTGDGQIEVLSYALDSYISPSRSIQKKLPRVISPLAPRSVNVPPVSDGSFSEQYKSLLNISDGAESPAENEQSYNETQTQNTLEVEVKEFNPYQARLRERLARIGKKKPSIYDSSSDTSDAEVNDDTVDVRQPPASGPKLMQGLTRRLFSALCALRIRLCLIDDAAATDKVLEDICWANPRSTFELSLVPGGEALAAVLADCNVQLLSFINKHAPMD